jgi:2-oxoglutarate dehydrogenase E2 component (dihydrolipoamide succinyltransferase)
MHEITVPKLNSNDERYVLVEWLAADGDELAPDSPVAVIETAKTAEELVADVGGILQQDVAVNAECGIGTVIGRLFPTEQAKAEYLAAIAPESADAPVPEDAVITKSAAAAAEELGVDLSALHALGKKVVKRRDVEEFAARASSAAAASSASADVRLPAAQQAVGQAVTRSHQSIPAAFLAVKVPLEAVLALRGRLAARPGATPAGLPEVLVKAVAELRDRFPLCFGSYREGGAVSLVPGAHVGVTLDLGKGLYVPVVKDVAARSLAEVADALADFRISALRGSFHGSELADGNITISLSNDPGTVLARPIIFPGQACVVCLCAPQEELYLTGAGDIAVRHFVNLGLSYDHRVLNGRDASRFLQELTGILADPDALSRLAAEAPGEPGQRDQDSPT